MFCHFPGPRLWVQYSPKTVGSISWTLLLKLPIYKCNSHLTSSRCFLMAVTKARVSASLRRTTGPWSWPRSYQWFFLLSSVSGSLVSGDVSDVLVHVPDVHDVHPPRVILPGVTKVRNDDREGSWSGHPRWTQLPSLSSSTWRRTHWDHQAWHVPEVLSKENPHTYGVS